MSVPSKAHYSARARAASEELRDTVNFMNFASPRTLRDRDRQGHPPERIKAVMDRLVRPKAQGV